MGDQVFHKWLYFNVANSTQLYILRPPSVLKSVIPANPPILFYFFSDFQVPGKALRECGSTWKCRTANPKQSLLVYVHCKLLYVFVSLVLAHLLILLTLSSWKKTAKENKNKGFCPRTGKKKKKRCPWTPTTLPPLTLASPEGLLFHIQGPPAVPCAPTTLVRNPYLKRRESQLRMQSIF